MGCKDLERYERGTRRESSDTPAVEAELSPSVPHLFSLRRSRQFSVVSVNRNLLRESPDLSPKPSSARSKEIRTGSMNVCRNQSRSVSILYKPRTFEGLLLLPLLPFPRPYPNRFSRTRDLRLLFLPRRSRLHLFDLSNPRPPPGLSRQRLAHHRASGQLLRPRAYRSPPAVSRPLPCHRFILP